MDDLFQLILFALFILFGLLSSLKRKKPTPPPPKSQTVQRSGQQARRTRPQPSIRTVEASPQTGQRPTARAPVQRTGQERKPEPSPVSRMEELFELLQERVERQEPFPEPEPVLAPEPVVEVRERPSPSMSEAATQARRVPQAQRRSRGIGLRLNPTTARQGIILAEVLGPPKGLSE